MSGNSSSSNDSNIHPQLPPTNISHDICIFTDPSSTIFHLYYIVQILLLLPLSIFISYLGLQRWLQQRSTTTATSTTSHSDVFTYHMVVMEIVGVSGCMLILCGTCTDHVIHLLGLYLWSFNWYGEMFFHVLTCFERYLAVVHPTTYMTLRGDRGVRVRNISVGCVWLLSLALTCLLLSLKANSIWEGCLLISCVIVTTFCSFSVLRVLIRPGPGERGGARERVDQSKQRAFYTIVAILVVLFVRFTWNMVWLYLELVGSESKPKEVEICENWCNLPSSLVLPLLFLHRTGKLTCCKKTNN